MKLNLYWKQGEDSKSRLSRIQTGVASWLLELMNLWKKPGELKILFCVVPDSCVREKGSKECSSKYASHIKKKKKSIFNNVSFTLFKSLGQSYIILASWHHFGLYIQLYPLPQKSKPQKLPNLKILFMFPIISPRHLLPLKFFLNFLIFALRPT